MVANQPCPGDVALGFWTDLPARSSTPSSGLGDTYARSAVAVIAEPERWQNQVPSQEMRRPLQVSRIRGPVEVFALAVVHQLGAMVRQAGRGNPADGGVHRHREPVLPHLSVPHPQRPGRHHGDAARGRPTTLPVGFGGDEPQLSEQTLQVGDRVLCFTDGLIEEHHVRGEQFG